MVVWKLDGVGVVVVVKDEMFVKVVEGRSMSDTMMASVLVFENDVMRLICGYTPQSRRGLEEKYDFMMS